MTVDWWTAGLGLLGTGAVGAWGKDLIKLVSRRVPDVETAAERETKRIETRENALDKATKEFQDSIRRELDQVHQAHKDCEERRRIDHKECQETRMLDREKVVAQEEQIKFLRECYDNLQIGAPNGTKKAKATQKRQRP